MTVLEGPDEGKILMIQSVRMFATDNGYYLAGGAGLYHPQMVALERERVSGNPCGTLCDAQEHRLITTCGHCRGVCPCRVATPDTAVKES
ncbi:hypothetical protein [Streptomyces mobaraensis]|uniref:Uncharacterized protein n=1 Tax=Streptomyces mobaraensis TaxID=35621 RepID=A0A5N5W1F9_STRMB|nr:hypothetical protein [Streptomyces mobaraensis]KAB7835709.1 hypothetical protein FRZ00_26160 [Streptomyces mobaraensis]